MPPRGYWACALMEWPWPQRSKMESSDRVELLPLEEAKSLIWTHFGFKGKDGKIFESDKKKRKRVYCKLCPGDFSYSGNTTNMWNHLEDSHIEQYCHCKERSKESSTSTESSSTKRDKQQMTIGESIKASQPLPRSSPWWKALTESVCYFIAKDLQPYDTVNDAGFLQMISTFEPRYKPPDRKSLATNYLPKMYDCEKEKIKQQVSKI